MSKVSNRADLVDAYRAANTKAEHYRATIERLRAALDKAAGRLGYLSTVLSHSNKPSNAQGALEWSEEARAMSGLAASGGDLRPELCRCGRPAVYLNRRVGDEIRPDPTPYCSACEYQPCATCDCVRPER